jgi:uncharacterized protein YjbI with pentapeptide repeats
MTQEELDERIRLHRLHLAGKEGGQMLDLSGEDLSGLDLSRANLRGAILRGANLRWAKLRGADLRGAILIGADLRGAILIGAILSGADLRGADLREAILRDALLREADLSRAILSGADFNGCAGNMSEVKSMHIDTWPVTYTADTLQIGCQRHPIARWREWRNDLEWIRRMDGKAEAWAERHLDLVLAIIDASPATPTRHEEDGK